VTTKCSSERWPKRNKIRIPTTGWTWNLPPQRSTMEEKQKTLIQRILFEEQERQEGPWWKPREHLWPSWMIFFPHLLLQPDTFWESKSLSLQLSQRIKRKRKNPHSRGNMRSSWWCLPRRWCHCLELSTQPKLLPQWEWRTEECWKWELSTLLLSSLWWWSQSCHQGQHEELLVAWKKKRKKKLTLETEGMLQQRYRTDQPSSLSEFWFHKGWKGEEQVQEEVSDRRLWDEKD